MLLVYRIWARPRRVSMLPSISDYRLIADGVARPTPKIVALELVIFHTSEGRLLFRLSDTEMHSAFFTKIYVNTVSAAKFYLYSTIC